MTRRIFDRLTGREAASLRRQRDAHAEEAGRERQRRMEAERNYDNVIEIMARQHASATRLAADLSRAEQERDAARNALQACSGVAAAHATVKIRGVAIWKLQNRLTRWQRRYRRAMVALHTWKPEAQAWKARAEEYERERDTFRTALQTTIGVAKQWERDCEEAVALLQRLTTDRDEHALAEAAEWLRARNFAVLDADRKARSGAPVSAPMDLDVSDRDMWPDHHAEQEGSRGGIAWMPGEALPDE